jgi:hypothetical protein
MKYFINKTALFYLHGKANVAHYFPKARLKHPQYKRVRTPDVQAKEAQGAK